MDSTMIESRGLGDRLAIAAPVLAASTTFYFISLSFYRLYFHLIVKIPRPKTQRNLGWELRRESMMSLN
jgi:hypothetical protein